MGVYIYQSGTEKEMQNAYIGEYRVPGSNTVAYFPFENDQFDKVGSAVISTTGTKQTLGYKFDITGTATISNITNSKFCCFWVKFGTTKNTTNQTPSLGLGDLTYNYNHPDTNFYKTFSYQYSSSGWGHSNAYNTSSGQRYFLAYGYTGTNAVAYFNGIKVMDVQTSLYNSNSWQLGNYIDETLSELIFEDRCRTAEQVANYYNSTKSLYGIS